MANSICQDQSGGSYHILLSDLDLEHPWLRYRFWKLGRLWLVIVSRAKKLEVLAFGRGKKNSDIMYLLLSRC